MHRYLHLLSLCVAGMLLVMPVHAQEFGRVGDVTVSGTSYRVFARPGDATVQVLVIGASSGLYEVGVGTRLDQLLVLTGQGLGNRSSTQKTKITIRLKREDEGVRTLVYEQKLEDMLRETSLYPELRDGDVFEIETITKTKFTWRDAFRVVTTLSSLILLVDRWRRIF